MDEQIRCPKCHSTSIGVMTIHIIGKDVFKKCLCFNCNINFNYITSTEKKDE